MREGLDIEHDELVADIDAYLLEKGRPSLRAVERRVLLTLVRRASDESGTAASRAAAAAAATAAVEEASRAAAAALARTEANRVAAERRRKAARAAEALRDERRPSATLPPMEFLRPAARRAAGGVAAERDVAARAAVDVSAILPQLGGSMAGIDTAAVVAGAMPGDGTGAEPVDRGDGRGQPLTAQARAVNEARAVLRSLRRVQSLEQERDGVREVAALRLLMRQLGMPVCRVDMDVTDARLHYDRHRPADTRFARSEAPFPISEANEEASLALATAVAEARAAGHLCEYAGCETPKIVEYETGRISDFCCRMHANYHALHRPPALGAAPVPPAPALAPAVPVVPPPPPPVVAPAPAVPPPPPVVTVPPAVVVTVPPAVVVDHRPAGQNAAAVRRQVEGLVRGGSDDVGVLLLVTDDEELLATLMGVATTLAVTVPVNWVAGVLVTLVARRMDEIFGAAGEPAAAAVARLQAPPGALDIVSVVCMAVADASSTSGGSGASGAQRTTDTMNPMVRRSLEAVTREPGAAAGVRALHALPGEAGKDAELLSRARRLVMGTCGSEIAALLSQEKLEKLPSSARIQSGAAALHQPFVQLHARLRAARARVYEDVAMPGTDLDAVVAGAAAGTLTVATLSGVADSRGEAGTADRVAGLLQSWLLAATLVAASTPLDTTAEMTFLRMAREGLGVTRVAGETDQTFHARQSRALATGVHDVLERYTVLRKRYLAGEDATSPTWAAAREAVIQRSFTVARQQGRVAGADAVTTAAPTQTAAQLAAAKLAREAAAQRKADAAAKAAGSETEDISTTGGRGRGGRPAAVEEAEDLRVVTVP